MRKSRTCLSLSDLGNDLKAARTAMHLTRQALAEKVGIDPRYLANIENSGSLPSLPIFYELVRICKLPLELYFFEMQQEQDTEQRRRIRHKLALCREEFLPVIEGALNGMLKVQEDEHEKGE